MHTVIQAGICAINKAGVWANQAINIDGTELEKEQSE